MQTVKLAFQAFHDEVRNVLGTSLEVAKQLTPLSIAETLQTVLPELGDGVVALYTLVSKERLWIVLVTRDIYKAYEIPISAADINAKVVAFRQVVQEPRRDPRPLAKEWYDLLIEPIAADLQAVSAQTLMWSLDGGLRYLPLAALSDGQQYLIERYRLAVFTVESWGFLRDRPSPRWRVAGLGVSKPQAGFEALSNVVGELSGIVRTKATNGALPGVMMLDERFTRQALESALRERYPVIHIASHFQFQPGDETKSFLLLGDGQTLSIATLKGYQFAGIELLTLSACNTAFGSTGDGREIESFAMLAQRGGAHAVVASLWPVADASTKELMQQFYRFRESKKGMSKAEALRQAQLALLHGEQKEEAADKARGVVQVSHDSSTMGEQNNAAPQFVKDPTAPYSHPYYWAPFILIGNWK